MICSLFLLMFTQSPCLGRDLNESKFIGLQPKWNIMIMFYWTFWSQSITGWSNFWAARGLHDPQHMIPSWAT